MLDRNKRYSNSVGELEPRIRTQTGEKRLSEFNNFVKPNLTHKVSNLKPSIRFYASFPLTSGNHRVHHTNSKLQNYGKTVRTLILSPS